MPMSGGLVFSHKYNKTETEQRETSQRRLLLHTIIYIIILIYKYSTYILIDSLIKKNLVHQI